LAARVYQCLENLLQVDFEYKVNPASTAKGASPLDLAQVTLPEDLALRLTMAAELHSTTVLKSCLVELEQLGAPGQRLAVHLRGFVQSFQMETIAKIVAQISVEPASMTGHP
jgi:hypothetical protein